MDLKNLTVGLLGSTGLVGETFLQVLEDRDFPVKKLRAFASEKSLGKTVSFKNTNIAVEVLSENILKELDFLFIATGEDISKKWSPLAVKHDVFVIDNSSAFRLDSETPLVCPEVNNKLITQTQKLYANPNCSTIQLVVLLKALQKAGTLSSVTVASYQAVSGAGREALNELENQTTPKVFPKNISANCIPQIGSFDSFGFSSEEQKIINETKKILKTPNLKVSAQTVRVPVMIGHAESVWVEFGNEVKNSDVLNALKNSTGLIFNEDSFETPLEVSGKDEVYVSRVRADLDFPNRWVFWLVADNMRKGAATNSVQIAESVLSLF